MPYYRIKNILLTCSLVDDIPPSETIYFSIIPVGQSHNRLHVFYLVIDQRVEFRSQDTDYLFNFLSCLYV